MDASSHDGSKIEAVFMVIVFLFIMISTPFGAIGQDKKLEGGGESSIHQKSLEPSQSHFDRQKSQQSSPNFNPITSGVDLNSISGDYTIYEHDQMWNRNPNPNTNWDFRLFGQGEPAGNINGDNMDDFIVTGSQKTAVFFGGNTSIEPDQIIDRKLKPVGDLNGDGYADAVAVDTMDNHYIYEGSSTGYNQVSSTLNDLDPTNFNILGFIDFNQDGREDIFAYSETTGEIKLTLGSNNFGDILVDDSYGTVLSSLPKKVIAKNIDQDPWVEIVEFSGGNGDGQIKVFEYYNLEEIFLQATSFGFNPSFEDARQTDLHLIDVNANEHDDIYISLGRDSPKYVMEYDTTDSAYLTPTEILDGELVPAGDLNNDGRHDFIMGDPNDNYSPHIAYGSSDLSTSLSLDVELGGNNSSNWSWEMGYNPYSSFGDLNGDDIDDAILAHNAISENGISYGRRILFGSEEETDNSEFQLYPRAYFFNVIYEVEELGDVNGDGVDDFGMAFYDQGKVEIYYGGSSISESPDQSFSSGYYLEGMTKGDFTGDGTTDIAIISQGNTGYQIEFFEGGSSFNRLKSIPLSDFQDAEVNHALGINNIGDVNGDGSSDILIGSGLASDTTGGDSYLNQAYLFLGGSSISSIPENVLNMDPSGDFFSTNIGAAASATSLGDLNGDGLNDFAVGSPLKGSSEVTGEVYVYLSNGNTPSNENEPIRLTPSMSSWFGLDLVAGDVNGDGLKDLAISATTTDTVARIYYGGQNFGDGPDQSLALPNFVSEGSETNIMLASLEAVPDFDNDGKDELIIGSSNTQNHAALYTNIDTDNPTSSLIKGANSDASLGGTHFFNKHGTMATGDFTNNGELDLVISQFNDNSDGISTSRIYRYALTLPLTITSVEDIPNDQGGEVRVNVGGYLMNQTSGYDSLAVQRMTANDVWKTLITDSGANSYDVPVPRTQPTNNNEVDYSYTFRVLAYKDTVIAGSQQVTGRAFDNISPPQVQGVSLIEQEGTKELSWQVPDIGDLENYLIYHLDSDGQLPDTPIDSTGNTSFTLPGNYEGVQKFVIAARDTNNNVGEVSAPVDAIYPKTVEYATEGGWDLIGLPVEANPDSMQSLLEDLMIYEYDGGYNQVTQLEKGKGYWAKFSDPEVEKRSLEGLPFTEFTVDLKKGWNLVSGVGGKLPVESIQGPDEILLTETLFAFNETYVDSDTLRPGYGYWIRASSAGTVTFTHPGFSQSQTGTEKKTKNALTRKREEVTKEFNKIKITNGTHSRVLFFGEELPDEVNKLQYSLPPLPPGDAFDARFEEGTRLVEHKEANIQLQKIGNESITLRLDGPKISSQEKFIIKEYVDGKLHEKYKISPSKEFHLKNKKTDSIYLSPEGFASMNQDIPKKFNLEQNYPNPFNPSTQIEYAITEQAEVTLQVFNILGKKVRTLVHEEQSAGNYKVTFNGSDLASGVYLYRLRAGDKVDTKKFILVK